jgi:hypothetical protein
MQVQGNLQASIQTEVIKKSQDIVKNIIGDILEKSFENSKKLQEEVAKATNTGINLDIKA